MRVTRVRLRNFRTYAAADVAPSPGLTVVHGPNGAGKTNLLEGLYFGCTGRSCRTANEREMVRFGAQAARSEVDVAEPQGGVHALSGRVRARRGQGAACRRRARGKPPRRRFPTAGVGLPPPTVWSS